MYTNTHGLNLMESSERIRFLLWMKRLQRGGNIKNQKSFGIRRPFKKITSLHPNIRNSAEKFILDAQNQQIYLKITSGYRSIIEQNNLYLKGRTLNNGKYSTIGKTVTNAKGGESYHNFGLAIDIVEIKDKKALWNNDWEKLGKIGKKHGFEWGGEWTKFKDKPHFQMTFGNSTKTLLKKVENQEMESGYVKL